MGPVLSVREAAGGHELLSQLCHKTHKNSANHNFSFHCQKKKPTGTRSLQASVRGSEQLQVTGMYLDFNKSCIKEHQNKQPYLNEHVPL